MKIHLIFPASPTSSVRKLSRHGQMSKLSLIFVVIAIASIIAEESINHHDCSSDKTGSACEHNLPFGPGVIKETKLPKNFILQTADGQHLSRHLLRRQPHRNMYCPEPPGPSGKFPPRPIPHSPNPVEFQEWYRGQLLPQVPSCFRNGTKYGMYYDYDRCCNGKKIEKGMTCCADKEMYNATTHGCCGSVAYPLDGWICCMNTFLGPGNACCNWFQPYNNSEQICCQTKKTVEGGGWIIIEKLSPIDPVSGSNTQCCSFTGFSYDSSLQTCCPAHPSSSSLGAIYDTPDATCCCESILNPGEVCCDPIELGLSGDTACFKGKGNACCASKPYNNRESLCCNNMYLFEDKHPDKFACCNGSPFSRFTELCCLGTILTIPDGAQIDDYECCGNKLRHKRNDGCCGGTEPYNKNEHLCCEGILHLDTPPITYKCCGDKRQHRSKQSCCAQKNVYEIDDQVCCHNHVKSGTSCCGGKGIREGCTCCDHAAEIYDCHCPVRCRQAGSWFFLHNQYPCHWFVMTRTYDGQQWSGWEPLKLCSYTQPYGWYVPCGHMIEVWIYQIMDFACVSPQLPLNYDDVLSIFTGLGDCLVM